MPPDTDDPESTATDAEVKSEPKPAAETKAGQKQPQTEAGTATDLDAIEPETIIIDAAPPSVTEYDPIEIDAAPQPGTREYDPTEDREKVRANIALILVYALVGVVAFALFSAWAVMPAENRTALFEVLKIVFTPLVGLVGAATGFYYGGKSK